MSPALVLAAAPALDAANPTVFLGLLIGALITIATLVDKVDAFVQRRRRTPPFDSELVELKGSIKSLRESVDTLTATQRDHASHAAEITALKDKVRFLETHRESDAQNQRSYIQKTSQEIFAQIKSDGRIMQDKLEALTNTINAEFRDLYRALGKAEGKLEDART